ncbi:MAG: hypothetical protein ACR2IT_10365 [Pirellulales bacterium]
MKFRSALLFACMLIVPAVAMFSHRLPSGIRASVREAISRTAARWTSPAPSDPTPEEAQAPVLGDQPAMQAAGNAAVPIAPAVAAVPSPASETPHIAEGDRRQWEEALGRLGAVRLDCRPLPGADGVHVASCGVALDASGQLVRVFHASGNDPAAATRALFDDVAGWKQRSAGHVSREPVVGGQPVSDRQRF